MRRLLRETFARGFDGRDLLPFAVAYAVLSVYGLVVFLSDDRAMEMFWRILPW